MSHIEALKAAKSMGAVMDAFELCQTVDDVHEFMAAYAGLISRIEVVPLILAKVTALDNIKFGHGYCGISDRSCELFAEWEQREQVPA